MTPTSVAPEKPMTPPQPQFETPVVVDLKTDDALGAMAAVGVLFHAAERGVVKDIFAAYGRLCRIAGREVSDALPRMQTNGSLLIPFSAQGLSAERIVVLQCAIGAAVRNANSGDAERHWRDADSAIKGFALAEASVQTRLAKQAHTEAASLRSANREGDAEQADRVADIRDEDASYFGLLAVGEGW